MPANKRLINDEKSSNCNPRVIVNSGKDDLNQRFSNVRARQNHPEVLSTQIAGCSPPNSADLGGPRICFSIKSPCDVGSRIAL